MVSIVAFQAIDPGSIPGQRIAFLLLHDSSVLSSNAKLHQLPQPLHLLA